MGALETGGFELTNTQVHQNLLLHHIGRSMSRSAILLREFCNMAGRAYRPADLLEISWRDLQWVEIQRQASPSQREKLPVREEVVEDAAGVISSVIVPTLAPAEEDTMEESDSTMGGPVIIARIVFCTIIIGHTNHNVFCVFVLVCSLSSLTDGMESKECEREEN